MRATRIIDNNRIYLFSIVKGQKRIDVLCRTWHVGRLTRAGRTGGPSSAGKAVQVVQLQFSHPSGTPLKIQMSRAPLQQFLVVSFDKSDVVRHSGVA